MKIRKGMPVDSESLKLYYMGLVILERFLDNPALPQEFKEQVRMQIHELEILGDRMSNAHIGTMVEVK